MNAQSLSPPSPQDMREEKARQRAAAATVAQAILVAHGWTAEPGGTTALATKAFDTAVGVKTAVAYLGNFDSEFCNCTLGAEYQSEGRNAASTAGVLIPKDASASVVQQLAAQFVSNVDEAVAETYAFRLLAERPRGV